MDGGGNPQLRRFLFRPIPFLAASNSKPSFEHAQFMEMREEIRQLKQLNFDRSGDITRELQGLKDLLHSAMKES